jgi:hypothetical protein
MANTNPASLSDPDLLTATFRATQTERDATARLVALLAEVDARRLYLGEGYSSMFVFCTRRLRMSEHAAYARIEAARLARRIPGILDRLADGRLSLTTIGLLAPHLDDDHCEALLDAATHQSKREVERLIASLHPQPAIQTSVRALPISMATAAIASAPTPPASSESLAPAIAAVEQPAGAAASRPLAITACRSVPVVAPLGPRQYLLRVTIGEETQRKLERARDLLRHDVPDGDLAAIIDRALTLLLSKAEHTKFAAATARPRVRVAAPPPTRSRRIPAAVRRAVWARDQGRCSFIGHSGRCGETGFLEFHHVVAFAAGGPSTVENLELRCRPHNGYEAERGGLTHWHGRATRSGPS